MIFDSLKSGGRKSAVAVLLRRRGAVAGLIAATVAGGVQIARGAAESTEARHDSTAQSADGVVFPSSTNAVQFRLYTNASPSARHLFNTFDIIADRQMRLQGPTDGPLKRWLADAKPEPQLHNILVNGEGPVLASTNNMSVIEQASGSEWRYVAFDAGAGYRGRLRQFKRSILFIEPDLFVLHDHLVAEKPSTFQMVLHPPAGTVVDAIWGDLRLDSTNGGMRINTPGLRHEQRAWSRVKSAADSILSGTMTVQVGPSNTLAVLDLVTVFAVYPAGGKKDYAFKLLQSYTAVGARIHRDGLPTLVAFKTDPAAPKPTLTGFEFSGPVGVDVFKPRKKRVK